MPYQLRNISPVSVQLQGDSAVLAFGKMRRIFTGLRSRFSFEDEEKQPVACTWICTTKALQLRS
jgi:hypothetical protein